MTWRRALRPKLIRQIQELGGIAQLLAPYLAARRRALAAGGALTVFLVVLRIGQPWPLKWIIDDLTSGGGRPASFALASALFLVLAAAAAWVEYAQVVSLVGLGNGVMSAFRADLFRHVLRQSLAYHERKGEGELLTRIVYDTTRLRKGINNILTHLLQTVLMFVAIVGVLFLVDAVLASIIAVAGAVALWVMARGGNRVRKAARKNRKREGKLATVVADDLIAVRELQTFRPEPGESRTFEQLNAKSLKQESKVQRLASGMLLRVEILVSAGIALVLLLGTHRVTAGAVSAGELVLFVSYAAALYRPFFRFARQATRMGTTVASADRLQKIMLREPGIVDAPDAVEAGPLRGDIEFRQVGVRNPKRRRGTRGWALRGVSFRAAPGERVAVVGANGAGKSSLIRLLLRLADPREGEIRIDGLDGRSYSVASLRGEMSVVLQGSLLFGLSIRDNLLLARPDASDAEILEAAERTRALEVIERLPAGLETVVRRHGRLFSAGERQRLVLTRALLRTGSVWLLDEPTTGLDEASARATVDVLEAATRGRTTFWITHDPEVAERLDRVLYLADGRISFFGTPEEFRGWNRSNDQQGVTTPQAVLPELMKS